MQEHINHAVIERQMARYANSVDRGDIDRVISLFTSDATFKPMENYHSCKGHNDIRLFFNHLGTKMKTVLSAYPKPFFLCHHLTTCVLEFESDQKAKGFTRFLVMSPAGLDHSGYYSDIFVTHDCLQSNINSTPSWLLSSRKITLDWISPSSPINQL